MTLAETAYAVLTAADPARKVELTRQGAKAFLENESAEIGRMTPPARPSRPERPQLLPPNQMPKRSTGGDAGKVALLHALAHIEFNAIDLAWDIVLRFPGDNLPRAFYADWTRVALDEAEHFALLNRRLLDYNAQYGVLPAHDGLWQAAQKTEHDILARLAVAPMSLEARGLDTTPATIDKLNKSGDIATVKILKRIFGDEIRHVRYGTHWFKEICAARKLDAVPTYHHLVRTHFGRLKAPFNKEARNVAGLTPDFYEPLAD